MPNAGSCFHLLLARLLRFVLSVSSDVTQGDGDQERLKRQQELSALNLYQLQQLQYQYLLRYTQLGADIFAVFPLLA